MKYKVGETIKGFKILSRTRRTLTVECRCGKILTVDVGNFSQRQSNNCGCVAKEKLKGKKYGMLTLLHETEEKYFHGVVWRVRCECGTEKDVPLTRIKRGDAKSCGCYTYGMGMDSKGLDMRSKTRMYRIWQSIKARCYYSNNDEYKRYGGSGITVCERWLESFDNFKEDMVDNYSDDLSIDRIDPRGNYEPGNCRWADPVEQSYNQSISHRNTSGHAGVWWDKKREIWRVRIQKGGKVVEEEFTRDKDKAIKLRKEWEIKYYGYNR